MLLLDFKLNIFDLKSDLDAIFAYFGLDLNKCQEIKSKALGYTTQDIQVLLLLVKTFWLILGSFIPPY